jgi:hypothetical protein
MAVKFLGYDFIIEYKKGPKNSATNRCLEGKNSGN